MEERIYSPRGTKYINRERHGVKQVFELGFALGVRNIKAKYRQSILGVFWAFLPPIITAAVWVFLTNQGVIQLEDAGVPYPLFVLAGTTCWQIFVQSLLMPTQIVNANKSILTKINFPRQAILVAGLVELLVPLMAGLIILAATMGIMGQAPGFWLIPGVVLLLIFVLGGFFIGLFLLPIGILFKDVQYGLPAIMQMLMYLTPVVYPKPDYQGFARVLDYNPVTPVITAARAWIINMPEKPGWEVLLIATGVIFMLGYVGLVLYRVTLSVLIERMGT